MDVGREYLEQLFGAGGVLDRALAHENLERLVRAAELISGAREVYCYGTGHSFLLGQALLESGRRVRLMETPGILLGHGMLDSTYYEGSQACVEAIRSRWLCRIGPGDAVIIASNSGNNQGTVGVAELLADRGVPVVGLTSMAHTRAEKPKTVSGRKLFEVCSAAVDNGGVHGDAILSPPGVLNPTAATSTVMGLLILGLLMDIRELRLAPSRSLIEDKLGSAAAGIESEVRELSAPARTAGSLMGQAFARKGILHGFGFGPGSVAVEEISYRAGGAFAVNVLSYHRNLRYSARNRARGCRASEPRTVGRVRGWMNRYFTAVRPFHDNDVFLWSAMESNELNRAAVESAAGRSMPVAALVAPGVAAPPGAILLRLPARDRLEQIVAAAAAVNIMMAEALQVEAARTGVEAVNYLSGNVGASSGDYELRRARAIMKLLPYLTGFYSRPDPRYRLLFDLAGPVKHAGDLAGWRARKLFGRQ